MYSIKYEKTLPPWYSGIEKIEAETSEDAVKEFYKRHNSFEERIREVSKMQAPTNKNNVNEDVVPFDDGWHY